MTQPRLLIADDDAVVRYLLRKTLEAEFEIVGEASDGSEVVAAAEQLHPDLVLLDVSMPGVGGFAAAEQMRERVPALPIIFVSQHSEMAYADQAFHVGGRGYVLKRAFSSELLDAVRKVLGGGVYRSSLLH